MASFLSLNDPLPWKRANQNTSSHVATITVFLEKMKIGGIVKHVFKNYDDEDDDNSTLTYYNIQQKSNILLMAHLKRSENTLLQQVIASIKSGDVTIPARNNELMIKYDSKSLENPGQDQMQHVSQGIRQLPILLIDFKTNNTDLVEATRMTLKHFTKGWILRQVHHLC